MTLGNATTDWYVLITDLGCGLLRTSEDNETYEETDANIKQPIQHIKDRGQTNEGMTVVMYARLNNIRSQ